MSSMHGLLHLDALKACIGARQLKSLAALIFSTHRQPHEVSKLEALLDAGCSHDAAARLHHDWRMPSSALQATRSLHDGVSWSYLNANVRMSLMQVIP